MVSMCTNHDDDDDDDADGEEEEEEKEKEEDPDYMSLFPAWSSQTHLSVRLLADL